MANDKNNNEGVRADRISDPEYVKHVLAEFLIHEGDVSPAVRAQVHCWLHDAYKALVKDRKGRARIGKVLGVAPPKHRKQTNERRDDAILLAVEKRPPGWIVSDVVKDDAALKAYKRAKNAKNKGKPTSFRTVVVLPSVRDTAKSMRRKLGYQK